MPGVNLWSFNYVFCEQREAAALDITIGREEKQTWWKLSNLLRSFFNYFSSDGLRIYLRRWNEWEELFRLNLVATTFCLKTAKQSFLRRCRRGMPGRSPSLLPRVLLTNFRRAFDKSSSPRTFFACPRSLRRVGGKTLQQEYKWVFSHWQWVLISERLQTLEIERFAAETFLILRLLNYANEFWLLGINKKREIKVLMKWIICSSPGLCIKKRLIWETQQTKKNLATD